METTSKPKEFFIFVLKCMIVHALSYWVLGIIFSNLFNYKAIFQMEIIRDFMRSYDDGMLMFGVLSQPVRGILFGLIFWPFRTMLLEKKLGWLSMWGILVVVGIINTPGAAPSSIEGVLYSKLPIWYHFIGLPEVTLQTLVFSILFIEWDRKRYDKLRGIKKTPKPVSKVMTICSLSLMIGVFGYMAYAAAAIVGALLSGVQIDLKAASADFSQQIIFIVAFVFNFGISILIGFAKEKVRVPLPLLLIGFIALDIAVPFIYSVLFYATPFQIPFALLLGSVPGVIAALGNYFLFYKNPQTV